MSERHVEIVWDAIALHTTAEIPSRKCAEIALCQLGIAADLGIAPPDIVSHEAVDEVLAAYPWLETHEALLTTLVGLYQKKPQSRRLERGRRGVRAPSPGFQRSNLCDRVIDRSAHSVETRGHTS